MKDNYLSLGSHRTTIGRNLLKPKAPDPKTEGYKKTPSGTSKWGAVKIELRCPRLCLVHIIGSHKDNQRFETTKNLSGYIFTYVKVWFVAQNLT